MSMIEQIRYNNINCIKCGETLTADLTAFDFGRIFSDAIIEKITKTSLSVATPLLDYERITLWNSLIELDLHFYYTIRDICQELGYKMGEKATPLTLRAKDVMRQLEFLMNGTPFAKIRSFGKSSLQFNSLFNSIGLRQGIPEEKEENIKVLLKYLLDKDMEIIQVPVKIVLATDDSGHAIAEYLEYYINGEKKELRERVCPFCGAPLDHEAGFRNEFIIGMAGLSRVGKTALLASLISQLSKLDRGSYIHISPNESESLAKFRKTFVAQFEEGKELAKTEVEDENKVPLVYVPLQIGEKIVNLVFVDMPGEIYGGEQSEGLDYVVNKRRILMSTDVIWCCIEPAMINPAYVNGNGVRRDLNANAQLSKLISVAGNVTKTKKPAAVVLTQADLLKESTDLFHPEIDVMTEFLLDDNTLDANKLKGFSEETKEFMDQMINFSDSVKMVFDGISMFSVSSYGYDISKVALLNNMKVTPSMVELPLLWTLACLGMLTAKKTTSVKSRITGREKTIEEVISDRRELFLE